MSITKAQASLLSSNFLGGIGSDDKSGLVPRESLSELFLLAGEFIEDAQNNLNATDSIGSGKLSSSLEILEPKETGTIVSVDISMLKYGQYVNKGVKGTETGSSLAGFKFKTGYPNKKMANEIQKWIKRAGLSIRNSSAKKTVTRLEQKRHSVSQLNKGRAIAYAVATNIKRYGIKPTLFIDKAIKTTEAKIDDRFGKAFEIDILSSLPDKL